MYTIFRIIQIWIPTETMQISVNHNSNTNNNNGHSKVEANERKKNNQPTTKSLNLIYNLKSEKWNGKTESETSIYTVSGMEKEVNRS